MSQPVAQGFRLSPQQRRLWSLQKEAEGFPYRARAVARIQGPLDRAALAAALEDVAARHEILRTTFPKLPGLSLPAQAIRDSSALRLEEEDLSSRAPEERNALLDLLWEELGERPFQPDREPPVVVTLVSLGPQDHRLFIAAHALAADAAALEVLVRDLAWAYGQDGAVEEPAQYADVAEALNELLESEETEAGREFWREEGPLAVGRLPLERQVEDAGFVPRAVAVDAGPGILAAALELAGRRSVPLAAVPLAAWHAVLRRLASEEAPPRSVVAVELAGRHYEGFESALGLFARSLPLAVAVEDDLSFADLVSRAGERLAAAGDWQDYFSWEALSISSVPAAFRFMELLPAETAGGATFTLERLEARTDRFKLQLVVLRGPEGLRLELHYDASRFEAGDARHLLAAFHALLADAVSRPETRIGDLEVVEPEERRRLTEELNRTERPFEPAPVHELFAAQADRTPDAVAVSDAAGAALTYAELARRAARLAGHLRGLGVGTDVRVGLCAERSADVMVGVLAILESGGAYVPLDPSYPEARLTTMLEASRAPVLLIQEHLRDRLSYPAEVSVVSLTPLAPLSRPPSPPSRERGELENEKEVGEGGGAPLPGRVGRSGGRGDGGEGSAYVLFTSGSTGVPKGVVVRHRALTNHMLWMAEAYPLVAGDRVLQKTPLSFDASVWELFAPLLAGAELVLAAPGVQRDPAALAREAAERGATDLQVVPALLRLLLDEPGFAACRSLRRLYAGGEPLTLDLRDRFQRLFPEAELVNLYGPTETTVQVVTWTARPDDPGSTVPIGRPIHNARVYLLDGGLLPVPEGLPGEVWIGGDPPARGYLDRPDLTAASFRPDPFSSEPGARMYGSGDLARYHDGGVLEFLGRAGRPIKIRGYRFDPGEVEAALRGHASVRDAAVLVREDRLVAYLVPRDGGEPMSAGVTELRTELAGRLPEFMVPSDFVVLPAFPLTPSGKLDRNALPPPESVSAPNAAAGPGFVPPRSAVEEVMAEIWAGLLGRDRVGAEDDFFELGGHSLLGAQLVARIRDAFGVEVSLRSVFETPTVAGLARQVESAWQIPTAPPIERQSRPPGAAAPLSFAQRRLWFLDRLAPGTAVYNVPSAVRFGGPLDERALAAAFDEIVRLHEVLRSAFPEREGEPVQVAAPSLAVPMPVADLSGLSSGTREAEAERLAHEEARRPFDLGRGPLIRLTLLRLAPRERVLLTALHHIASDAWSVAIFYRDLMELYGAFKAGRPSPLPELPIQYADYSVWQRRWFQGEARQRELAWWARQLADLPALRLPGDRPRPAQQTFRGAALTTTLPPALTAPLRVLARSWNATPFMLLLAAFQTLLHRHTGQEEIVVGSPVANRERSEVEGLIGFFVNTLVLRASLEGNPAFLDLVGRARELTLDAWAHQSLPFEMLVEELEPERDLGRQPLFQVMFQLQNVPLPDFEIAGVTIDPLDVEPGTAHFDLGVDLMDTEDGLLIAARYATDLFDATTVRRLLAHFETLLYGIAAGPGTRIGDLPLLSEAERQQVGVEWGDTAVAVDRTPVHRRIAVRAALRPDATAVVFEDSVMTYGELDRHADRLAGQLCALGVRRGTPVGLRAERSLDLPAAILAIFKAGGVFLPFDPDLPAPRLSMMVEDSGAFVWAGELEVVEEEVAEDVGPDDLAYLIYTSGTSGRPKAVAVEHGSLSNLVDISLRTWGWDEGDRMACLAAFSFDIFLFELLAPLAAGGTATLFPLRPLDVARLARDLGDATRFHAVPALMREIVDAVRSGPGTVPGLRTVFTGGDRVPDDLPAELREVFPGAEIAILYGPTEGTVFCSSFRVPPDLDRALLGRPAGNATLAVRDLYGNLAPIGAPGEIVQGGPGVARGYYGREELTRERFFEQAGGRFYRTGDLGRWLPDGNLEFFGRLDEQVKVRGFRVEPGDVETALRTHPGVREAVVVAREDAPGERRLVAYVVCDLADSSLADTETEALENEQVERWRTLYDTDVYGREEREDPTFDTSGWNSSYTGEPIPAEEMREWVDGTVSRILSRLRDGSRVLEIGCGTGLLLFRLAPHCREYVATDFSEAALAAVREGLERRPLPGVQLLQVTADDFTGVEPGSFDAVVINSVVQYFPDAEYLTWVLAGAVEAVRPGGFVFVGDVRSLPLLDAFHASVELEKAPLSREQLARRARRATTRREEDPELVIDPRLFTSLPGRWPRVSGVEVQLRRGRRWNELVRFRYDAVLTVEGPRRALEWPSWEALSPGALRERLLAETPERAAVRRVPNARVAAELALWELLQAEEGPETADEIRREVLAGGSDPEDFWALAGELPYDVAVTVSADRQGGPGFFDVLLQRREERSPAVFDLPVDTAAASEPWERLTNHPLRRRQVRQAAPRLRAYLEERLPDYMVPAAVVLLDRLPLNARGKLDRRALPVPERVRPDLGEVVTPRTPTEEILAGLFAEVLGIDRVGVRDSFFALGGHSLLATQLVSQIRQMLGVEVPLRSVFETPTVAGLARQIESVRQVPTAPPIVREPRPPGAAVPLSFAQRRLWFLERLAPGAAVYNVASAVRFTGPLDERALAAAFDGIVRRHEVLRATFQEEDGEPVQVAVPSLAVPMPVADLTALPRGRRDEEAERLAFAEARRPFDLARGPLVRLTLLWLGPRERVLLASLHHIVSDAWSVGIFYRGLMELYGSFAAGQPATLPELPVQYADYAVWQRRWFQGETRQRELAWWARQLADLPALRLPADRPRPARQTFRGTALTAILPVEVSNSLDTLARSWGATPFMLLLAAYQTLLHRYTGQEEVVVGSPVANRERAEVEGLIGFFVNTLVLRASLGGNPDFPELVGRVRELTLDAWAHQSLPFEMLVEALEPERDFGRQPLFQVMFQLQNVALPRFEIAGVAIEPLDVEPGTAHFDLGVDLMEMADGLLVSIRYATDLFDATTIRRLLEHFETLLRGIAANPGARLGDLPLLSEAERQQVGVEWSDTAVAVDRTPVHRRIAARAALQPDAPAVTFEGATQTYGELGRRVDRLAAGLRGMGVRRGTPVGLHAERSLDLPAAILAIFKAGGVFLPLDPGLPEPRLAAMVEDAGALVWNGEIEAVEEGGSPEAAEDVGPDDLAYLIYTSGTSGRPKAVAVEHGSLSNLVDVSLGNWGWNEGDRMASLASFSFDIFLFELLVPLAAGGAVTLFPLRPLDVARLARELPGLTRFHAVPALMREIVKGVHSIPGLRTVFLGGDRVPDDLTAALREAFPGAEIAILYGPTEGTVFCSSFRVPPGHDRDDRGLLGRPSGNAILAVRDLYGNLAPIGASGEIVQGGPGVARGYLGREELTRERFFAQDGGRFYRTGDLGRWLADGNLEFLGRLDLQVKIRGFRVEPGEVETVLRAHPAVCEAAVVAREDAPGDLRLVAYVTGELGDLSLEEAAPRLRAYLAERLPDYMIPAAIVPLDRLPLTPHGKVDRRALPAPERVRWDQERVAPRTLTEEILAGLFTEVLGLDRVGVHDSFFALGGHSLLATQLISKVRRTLGVEIELRAFFESPTVEGLAARIAALERGGPGVPPLLPRVWRGAERPLSFSQRRLWFLDRLEPGGATYNMLTALRIRGPLALGVLAACLDEIARRHEVLRARIVAVEGQPVELIEPPGHRPLPWVDLSGLPARRRDPETCRLAAAEARRPFDLAQGPLLRAIALHLGQRDHALLLTLHHIVSDGWSEAVLVREVAALYPAFAAGLPSPLPALPLSYADFALWQREWLQGEQLETQVAYWRDALAGAPGRLDLPTDFPRPPVPSGRGRMHVFEVPEAAADAVRALCRRARTTSFMALFAAFGTLLGRLAGQDDVLVGMPIANRTRTETEGLIGFFVNTLVLRADLRGEPTGRELLARVREAALGAYAHQDLPFERLVEELRPGRELARQPLFQAMFVLQNAPRSALDVQGISLQPIGVDPGAAKFDLTMALNETGGGYLGTIEYSVDLFAPSTLVSLGERYNRLLAALAADPAAPVHALPLLHEGERHQLLREWNDTHALPPAACLHEMFEAQVDRAPEAVALIIGDGSLTYRELDRQANVVAHRLRRLGVGPEVTVGLRAGRTTRTVAGLLGILKAGGAYVPLDPDYPRERLELIAGDAGIRAWLTDKDLEEIGAEAGDPGRIATGVAGVGPDNLAYVIYTSGSTGVPKGVAVRHAGVTTMLAHTGRAVPAEALAGFLATTSISFDVSVYELFVPLTNGGTVILAENALSILDAPPPRPITLFSTVPSAMAELLRADALPPSVTTIDIGAETVPEEMVRSLLERPGIERIYNLYGPTEDTVCSTFDRIERGRWDGRVTIGRPIAGGRAYVLDARFEPVPAGTLGELFLGGAGVSRGYLHRPALTAERFLPDPFAEEPGGRLYRTGDLVRQLPDGRLDFLGRLDHQVKVRGFRIELGEIEAALARHPAVREAAVLARRDPAGTTLVAYVAAGGAPPPPGELRGFLRERLPEPFIPAAFVLLPSLPLNPNGKVDRNALARIEPAGIESDHPREKEAPRTPVEELLAAIWSEVLGVPRIGRDDDFFALSGHSLLAAQVAYRIESTFGVSLPLRRLFERATLAELALEIEAASRPGAPDANSELEPVVRVPRDRPLPVSFYQEWVWRVQGGPVSSLYNMPSAWRLRGRVDLAALGRAFAALLARHEVLRSRLLEVDGVILQEPVAVEVSLPVVDLEALPAEVREREALRLAREEAERPFDLTRPPLARALALRRTDEDHALCVTAQHSAADGWSLVIFQRELMALYAAAAAGRPSPLPDLPVQYADFACWQRERLDGEPLAAQLAYWHRRLAGLPPPLDLSAGRPRPERIGAGALATDWVLPPALTAALRRLGRDTACTLSMVLTAGFAALLHAWTGQEDFTLASIFSGRTRPELQGLIGIFMNTVVLRADLSGEPTFRGLLPRLRETVLEAYAHQDVSFPRLFAELFPGERLDRTRLARVAFNMLSFETAAPGEGETAAEPPPGGDNAGIESFEVLDAQPHALYDLALLCQEHEGGVYCQLVAAVELFDAERLAALRRDYTDLLTRAAADPDFRPGAASGDR